MSAASTLWRLYFVHFDINTFLSVTNLTDAHMLTACSIICRICLFVCEVSIENSGVTQNENSMFPLRAFEREDEWKTGFTQTQTHAIFSNATTNMH